MNEEFVVTKNLKIDLLDLAGRTFGDKEFSNAELIELATSNGYSKKEYDWVFNCSVRVRRGVYVLGITRPQEESEQIQRPQSESISVAEMKMPAHSVSQLAAPVRFDPNAVSEYSYAEIPERDPHFVPFGDFKEVETIVRSGQFFPIFVAGQSGNGKTFMIEQICSRAKRPMIRVQIARETDEDDLIGGFRLIGGETRFMKGPVLRAMELGAILLIDEADRGDPGKIMCMQGILEGKPYFVKKTGEIVKPAHGFNVIVTANTKGRGSDDGRYVAAGVLDDAWLERFPITIEQQYPQARVETRILRNYLESDAAEDIKFAELLVSWASIIRKTFESGGCDENMTTRRLIHIIKAYKLFKNKTTAVKMCVSRFDEETKTSFIEIFTKLQEEENMPGENGQAPAQGESASGEDDIPF